MGKIHIHLHDMPIRGRSADASAVETYRAWAKAKGQDPQARTTFARYIREMGLNPNVAQELESAARIGRAAQDAGKPTDAEIRAYIAARKKTDALAASIEKREDQGVNVKPSERSELKALAEAENRFSNEVKQAAREKGWDAESGQDSVATTFFEGSEEEWKQKILKYHSGASFRPSAGGLEAVVKGEVVGAAGPARNGKWRGGYRTELRNTKDAPKAYIRTTPTEYELKDASGKVLESYPRTPEGKRRAEMECAEMNKTQDAGQLATAEQVNEARRLISHLMNADRRLPQMLQGDMAEALKALRAAHNWLK